MFVCILYLFDCPFYPVIPPAIANVHLPVMRHKSTTDLFKYDGESRGAPFESYNRATDIQL